MLSELRAISGSVLLAMVLLRHALNANIYSGVIDLIDLLTPISGFASTLVSTPSTTHSYLNTSMPENDMSVCSDFVPSAITSLVT